MKKYFSKKKRAGQDIETGSQVACKIAIVGNPNVGKSVIFKNLTGTYAVVSNYPGTTVEVTRGSTKIGEKVYDVVDTPGMYSLMPLTEEEKVARRIIVSERPTLLLHVIDAKNIERMLGFTLQLIEAGLPVILVLNMMDEAEKLGREIDAEQLEKELNVPVVTMVATTAKGMGVLRGRIEEYCL